MYFFFHCFQFFVGWKSDDPVIPGILQKENLELIKGIIWRMKLTEIMQKQKMLSVASHGESKETILTEKAVQTDDNQAGVTQHFFGTGKSSKENITGIHSNRESDLSISYEQDLFNVPSSFFKHKPAVESAKKCSFLSSGTDRMKVLFQVFTNHSLPG